NVRALPWLDLGRIRRVERESHHVSHSVPVGCDWRDRTIYENAARKAQAIRSIRNESQEREKRDVRFTCNGVTRGLTNGAAAVRCSKVIRHLVVEIQRAACFSIDGGNQRAGNCG